MEGECYNCGYVGEFEWFWLITDSKNNLISVATHSMDCEEATMGDTHTRVYCCPKCDAEQ